MGNVIYFKGSVASCNAKIQGVTMGEWLREKLKEGRG